MHRFVCLLPVHSPPLKLFCCIYVLRLYIDRGRSRKRWLGVAVGVGGRRGAAVLPYERYGDTPLALGV